MRAVKTKIKIADDGKNKKLFEFWGSTPSGRNSEIKDVMCLTANRAMTARERAQKSRLTNPNKRRRLCLEGSPPKGPYLEGSPSVSKEEDPVPLSAQHIVDQEFGDERDCTTWQPLVGERPEHLGPEYVWHPIERRWVVAG